MIVVKQKRIEDVLGMLGGCERVLLAGCNTCAAVALAGGEREVSLLVDVLRLGSQRAGVPREFEGCVVQRQCEPEFLTGLEQIDADAVVSLACGAGVALLAERLDVPVYPGADTLFIGAARGLGSWRAECRACGNCVLGETAGICPMTRCAKGILNGPCGGVDGGKCEVGGDTDCAWVLIHQRLERLGKLETFDVTRPPKDFSLATVRRTWESDENEGGSR